MPGPLVPNLNECNKHSQIWSLDIKDCDVIVSTMIAAVNTLYLDKKFTISLNTFDWFGIQRIMRQILIICAK